MADVVVVDSGGANLASLGYALARLGVESTVSADPQRIRRASHVLLPGVGSAHDAMQRLTAAGLAQVIPQLTQPLLGICLGMQLLFDSSAETSAHSAAATDGTPGLGVIAGRVERLAGAPDRPVPHMGWNQMESLRADPLLAGISPADHVYFVHSYAAPVTDATLAVTGYGQQFASVVRRNNFRGVQFHPERSATVGARVLANFLALQE
ncbi:MAG: imidazole glycerol phosphate synthase subunit HisH [Pseudomonadota bacterium]